jgi:hypothetical protein
VGPNYALIEHWNGVRWRIARLPRLGQSMLYDVAAEGPRNAWAVGVAYVPRQVGRYRIAQPLLLHWNGGEWRRLSLPWSQNGLQLDKVIPTRRSSVWVVSRGEQDPLPSRLEYWNGRRWRHVRDPFGTKDRIVGFSATAGDDAWAVGSYALGGDEQAKYSHALAAHWNGRRWQLTPVPDPPGDNNSAALMDVSAAGGDDVWALGEAQRLDLHDKWLSSTGPVGYFVHWNGQSWQAASGVTPPIYEGFPAVTAARDGSAWAIGYCYLDDFSVRWTGAAWVTAPHPRDSHWRAGVPARVRQGRPPTCAGESG